MMKKSILLFFGTLLTFLIFDRIVTMVISNAEKKIFIGSSIGKVNQFSKVKDSVDVLVLGSSRALHHVDTRNFGESAFNIGADGKKVAYCAALSSMLQKKGQIVLVHIDHNRVFDKDYEGRDGKGLLYKAESNENLSEFYKTKFPTEYFISKGVHSYPYNGKALIILKNFLVKDSVNQSGYEPIFPTEEQKAVFANMFKEEKSQMNIGITKPLSIGDEFEKYVDYIQETAVANGSKLVFFTSPSLSKVDGEVHDKVGKFFENRGILYLDHLDYFENQDLTLWKDYTHLSAKGANLYTGFLKAQLAEHGVLPAQ